MRSISVDKGKKDTARETEGKTASGGKETEMGKRERERRKRDICIFVCVCERDVQRCMFVCVRETYRDACLCV